MRCPKCQFDHPSQTTECLKCGVIFSRYHEPQGAVAETATASVPPMAATGPSLGPSPGPLLGPSLAGGNPLAIVQHVALSIDSFDEAPPAYNPRTELISRALALPLALLIARFLVGAGFRMVPSMLAMVLHESGHAVTAWLTGRWAIPMLWVTMHGQERSWLIVLCITCAIAFLGFWAWKTERRAWLCVAGAMLVVQIIFLNLPPGQSIVFGGDGGALVFATILMATFYAPRESGLYKSWGLRWGLLVIGALAFMLVFHTWSGSYDDIPFGEIEGVNLSDPSQLTEVYGWSVTQLVDRYLLLARICLVALALIYIWGLISAYVEARTAPRTSAVSQ